MPVKPAAATAPSKLAARQAKFGNLTLDNRGEKRGAEAASPVDLEAKKKRAERFGLPLKGTPLAKEIEGMGKGALAPEEQEKIRQRGLRFGTVLRRPSRTPEGQQHPV